ncbi:MAG: PH domain-containing protein [Paenibacillaceae bacterium]
MRDEKVLWEGKPFNYGIPSFTQYKITDTRLIVEKGVFTKKREEIRLFRIRDISLKRSLMERILKMGDITLQTTDTTSPMYTLRNLKNSIEVADILGEAVENSRIKHKAFELTEVQT